MLTRKNLLMLESRIQQLDFVFLGKIQSQLLYKNPYFLLCLAEILHHELYGSSDLSENLSTTNLLVNLNKKAEHLYVSSNISEALGSVIRIKNGKE